MLSRPRSILFWAVLIVLLYIVATAPVELAHAVMAIWHSVHMFFSSLGTLIRTFQAA